MKLMIDTLLLIVSLPAFALACALWAVVGFEGARRSGYHAPGASTVLLVSACAGILTTLVRSPPNSAGFRFFVDFFWLTWLFASATTAALLLVLPRRATRTFGNRRPRFPFARAGQLLIAAAWMLIALTIGWRLRDSITSTQLFNGIALAVGVLVPTGRYLVRKGRRVEVEASSDANAIEALDDPVLYLRAFAQERQFFFIASAADSKGLAKRWHATVAKPDQNVGGTFEEYFAGAVRQSLGPLVALGSPEDYVAPEGAARLYAKDSDWMQHVDTLMRKARCILVEAGASSNLRWEFEHIRKEGFHEKLFLITRPSTEGKWLSWAFWRLVWRIQNVPSLPFAKFAAALAPLGYELGGIDPEPGSVIAFDADGKSLLLTTGASWPGEFVKPILDWTREGRKSGRHVPATCGRCGKRIYALPQGTDPASRECRDCRYGPPWKRAWKRSAAILYVQVWVFGGLLGVPVLMALIVPKDSFVDRHAGGIFTTFFIASLVALFWVLGRMADPPPLHEPDTSASGEPAGAAARPVGDGRRGRPGR
jgi:hypothetical protein